MGWRGRQAWEKLWSGRCALRSAPQRDPIEESLHAGAFAPEEGEEFASVERGGFVAEESFEAPLDVRGFPRAQAVATGDDPVVAQGVQHGEPADACECPQGPPGPKTTGTQKSRKPPKKVRMMWELKLRSLKEQVGGRIAAPSDADGRRAL
jgi:hypothetical protein